jgi:hypothetical protein
VTTTRGSQVGKKDDASFWKKFIPSMPSGYRTMETGRPNMCGSMIGEIIE